MLSMRYVLLANIHEPIYRTTHAPRKTPARTAARLVKIGVMEENECVALDAVLLKWPISYCLG